MKYRQGFVVLLVWICNKSLWVYANRSPVLFRVGSLWLRQSFQITKFMGPIWGQPGSCRAQMGSMLAPWTLLLGIWLLQCQGSSPEGWYTTAQHWIECCYNAVQQNTFHTALHYLEQNVNQSLNSQKAPHISPWRVRYGVSIEGIWENIDHIVTALHPNS